MQQRLSLVTLASHDLARSQRFYEALGWSSSFANEEVAFYPLNGIVFGLYRAESFAKEIGVDVGDMKPAGSAVAYNTRSREEVDAVIGEAQSAGAVVAMEPHDTPWGGYSGYFRDPDGHLWEVAWNPAWRIDDEGNIHTDAA